MSSQDMSSQVGEGLVKLLQVKSSWDWFIQTGRSSQKFFQPKPFQAKHFCGPNVLLNSKSWGTQNSVGTKICWTNNFVGPKIMLDPKYFWTQNLFNPKSYGPTFFGTKKFFGPKILGTTIFLEVKIFF